MAPRNKKDEPERHCSLANHPFQGNPRYINHPRLLSFVRRLIPEFKEHWEVCPTCYDQMRMIYKRKLSHALKHRSMTVQSSTDQSQSNNSSETSELSAAVSSTSSKSKENNKNVSNQQRQSNATIRTNTTTTTTSATSSADTVLVRRVRFHGQPETQRVHMTGITTNISNSESSLSDQPTTSAAAAKRARNKQNEQPPVTADSSNSSVADINDNDNDEWEPSPNALNGSRLPNVQPIPKRRKFVHANKDVMDIYLAGTTGG